MIEYQHGKADSSLRSECEVFTDAGMEFVSIKLEFEEVHALDVERAAIPRGENDDSKTDRGFRGGHDDYKQHEHLAVEFAFGLAERYECQIDGVQHQLNGHENGDDVALHDEGNCAKSEQNCAQHVVILRPDHVRLSTPAAP